MAGTVQALLRVAFPPLQGVGKNVLLLGPEGSGRSTALARLRLGEAPQSISHTLGVEVASVEVGQVVFSVWDIGGWWRIRPLWRLYFRNILGIIFLVDSFDHTSHAKAKEMLLELLSEPTLEGVPLLVLANKQDIPKAVHASELAASLGLPPGADVARPWRCTASVAPTGEGLASGLEWLVEANKGKQQASSEEGGSEIANEQRLANASSAKDEEFAEMFLRWIEQHDSPAEEFLRNFRDVSLERWDHRTQLRVAWTYLTTHNSRTAIPLIFEGIRNFVGDASGGKTKQSRGMAFHETMTYFWCHMVQYAIDKTPNPDNSFQTFLLLNPQLANESLFQDYYSQRLMFQNPDSRTSVHFPDLRPLPNIKGKSKETKALEAEEKGEGKGEEGKKGPSSPTPQKIPMLAQLRSLTMGAIPAVLKSPTAEGGGAMSPTSVHPVVEPHHEDTDDEFLESFEGNKLSHWSHDCLLRMMYLYLSREGRTRGIETILRQLKRVEKEGFHLTIAYFWIQMVDLAITQQQVCPTPISPNADHASQSSPDPSATMSAKVAPIPLDVPPVTDATSDTSAQQTAGESKGQVPTSDITAGEAEAVPYTEFIKAVGQGSERFREMLEDSNLYLQYYSSKALFSPKAQVEMVLPDKKALPSVVRDKHHQMLVDTQDIGQHVPTAHEAFRMVLEKIDFLGLNKKIKSILHQGAV